MQHLCDTNVWLALAIGQHSQHARAAEWFNALTEADTACFCRATHTSFLSLLTQKIAPGYTPQTNQKAWRIYDKLLTDDLVRFVEEPPATDKIWRKLSADKSPAPKTWMDAYLAAFCIAGGYTIVSLDKGMQRYESEGLALKFLE